METNNKQKTTTTTQEKKYNKIECVGSFSKMHLFTLCLAMCICQVKNVLVSSLLNDFPYKL